MAGANVGWGAPRFHGELLKLGFEISETTVSRYMPKDAAPPGSHHMHESLAIDFAVVPTLTFDIITCSSCSAWTAGASCTST